MKKLLWLGLAVVMVLAGLVVAGCTSSSGDGGSTGSLVGTWTIIESSDGSSVGYTVVFRADGTGVWMVTPMTYVYSGANLAVTTSGGTDNMTVKWLSGDKIEITSGDRVLTLLRM